MKCYTYEFRLVFVADVELKEGGMIHSEKSTGLCRERNRERESERGLFFENESEKFT